MQSKSKSIWQSKTFWLAVFQAIAGIYAVLLSENPSLSAVGWIAMVKSAVDVILRFLTDKPISMP